MKNLVKLVAMVAFVFQAGAMNHEKQINNKLEDINQEVNSDVDTQDALDALKASVVQTVNGGALDDVQQTLCLTTDTNAAIAALSKNATISDSEEKSKEANNQLEYLRELDKNIYAILNDTTPDQAPEPTNENLMKVQSEVDYVMEYAKTMEMVENLNQRPVDVRLDKRIVFDENGQADLVVDNNN